MERDFLKNLGLDEDKINKVMAQYGKDVQQYKELAEKNKELSSTNDALNDRIESQNKQLKDLSKEAGDSKELKAKLDAALEANTKQGKEMQAKLQAQQRNYALDNALRIAGAKNTTAVKSLINSDEITWTEDGKPTEDSLAKVLDPIKKSDSYMFNIKEDDNKPKPPKIVVNGNPTGNDSAPKFNFKTATYSDMIKFKHEHPQDFERLVKKENL